MLGQIVLRFAHDGTITPYLWELGDGPLCNEVDPDLINLAGMPYGWLWLDRFRDAFEHELTLRLGQRDQRTAAYAAWVFRNIRARLRRGESVPKMRRCVADALALDADALAIARRIGLESNPNASVHMSAYNEVVGHRADYDKLTRECPSLVPLYAVLRDVLPPKGEPAARLRRHLIDAGVSPATWRVIHHGNGRLLRLLPEFYRRPGPEAAADLMRIVDLLAPSTQPPLWFVRTLLYYFGNFGQRLDSYYPALQPLAASLRRLMALTERAGSAEIGRIRERLYAVVTWLHENEAAVSHPQVRKASWRWFEREAEAWEESGRYFARHDPSRWAAPFEQIELDGMTVVALQTPLALWDEGRAMRHCAPQLEVLCRSGGTLVFSIRRPGRSRPVATMRADFDMVWRLTQVAACANTVAPPAARRV
ncbi:MAG: hypothetical protein N3D71_02395, partial [Burkholderiaceae bacterium]|nr:hypothetical protein [Burkholderiaceae bacterium]